MREVTSFAQALSDPTRWRILQLVQDEALCVCELVDILGLPQSTISTHLQVIRQAGLLASERCGKWVYYRLERKYRGLFLDLGRFFATSPASDATLKADAAKSVKRLRERASSCCPGPVRLASGFKPEGDPRPARDKRKSQSTS